MSDIKLASMDDLLAELEHRCPSFVFCACTPRDGEPNCVGYKFHTFGNVATKRGLASMLDEYMEDVCRTTWEDDPKTPDAEDK